MQENQQRCFYYPNDTIFERFGTFEDPNSKLSTSPFVLIRHGQTYFN